MNGPPAGLDDDLDPQALGLADTLYHLRPRGRDGFEVGRGLGDGAVDHMLLELILVK